LPDKAGGGVGVAFSRCRIAVVNIRYSVSQRDGACTPFSGSRAAIEYGDIDRCHWFFPMIDQKPKKSVSAQT